MPSMMIRVADAMRSDGYLPHANAALGAAAKAKLAELLASSETPVLKRKPIQRASVHASVWLSAVQMDRLDALADQTGLSPGETASALLLRDFDQWSETQKAPIALAPSLAPSGALQRALARENGHSRAEQESMLLALRKLDAGDSPKVLFCEAGTGTGKTLAYLGYAIDHLQATPSSKVMVAAPSFGLLAQIRSELDKFGHEAPTTVFLAGQGEWISRSALSKLLDERGPALPQHQVTALRQWLETGLPSDTQGRHTPWSMNSMLAVAPRFPFADDVTVVDRHDDEDLGWIAYEHQFERAAAARLVVLTHAMLANLTKRRLLGQSRELRENEDFQDMLNDWKTTPKELREQRFYEVMNSAMQSCGSDVGCDRLPDVDLLIIDEAHCVEDAFANAFGEYVAVRTLIQLGRQLHNSHPGLFPQNALTSLLDFERQSQHNAISTDEVLDLNGTDLLARLSTALMHCTTPRKGASKAMKARALKSRPAQRLTSVKHTCDLVTASSSQQMAGYMHWSPVLDYPRLSIGRSSLAREMDYVWSVVAKRTALVSGTLYEEIPRSSCETLRRRLAINPNATVVMSPIHAPWQITPVTLMMAADAHTASGRPRLRRPSSRLPECEREPLRQTWLDDICAYIADAHRSAIGGVLVLGTAFADIAAIADRLQPHGMELIVQRPGVKMEGLRRQFLESSRQTRPVLLAVGMAWTGFDLHDPENPDALTDLVIINAPLGLFSRTVARLRQHSKGGNHFEISSQALILVRQAIGRLVRSPDTKNNRRIHWLDSRIHDPKMRGIFSSITRFLARYKSVSVT